MDKSDDPHADRSAFRSNPWNGRPGGMQTVQSPPPTPATATLPTQPTRETSDTDSVTQAMEAFRPYLLSVANQEIASDLFPKAGASDIVQDTYIEATRDVEKCRGKSPAELKAWLRGILRNNLSNFARHYRRTRRRSLGREVSLDRESPDGRQLTELSSSNTSPIGFVMRQEEIQALEAALSRLSERDRQVILWRSDECSFEEIGRRLGGSSEMARKSWGRAIERLRSELGPM